MRGSELIAEALVLRRGSNLCFCEAKVHGAADGRLVVTYELGSDRALHFRSYRRRK